QGVGEPHRRDRGPVVADLKGVGDQRNDHLPRRSRILLPLTPPRPFPLGVRSPRPPFPPPAPVPLLGDHEPAVMVAQARGPSPHDRAGTPNASAMAIVICPAS